MRAIRGLILILVTTAAATISIVYAQVDAQGGNTEGTTGKTTYELSCEFDPDSGLLCSNSGLGLCILRTDTTDVGGDKMWNIMNPMLCEVGE